MSEPSSLDSLPEHQLPDWKTVVWNVANEIDWEKVVSGLVASLRNHFIATARRWCQVIAMGKWDAEAFQECDIPEKGV